jgi:hypothetical protein
MDSHAGRQAAYARGLSLSTVCCFFVLCPIRYFSIHNLLLFQTSKLSSIKHLPGALQLRLSPYPFSPDFAATCTTSPCHLSTATFAVLLQRTLRGTETAPLLNPAALVKEQLHEKLQALRDDHAKEQQVDCYERPHDELCRGRCAEKVTQDHSHHRQEENGNQ